MVNWFGVRRVGASPSRSTVGIALMAFILDAEDSSTRPGARRLSLSLVGDGDDDEAGEARDVGPTMRRERSGASWARDV